MKNNKKPLNIEVDDEASEEIEENVLPPNNIVVLNELRSASDLYRLMSSSDSINLHPDFQRNEVWTPEARARFIDSLSKEFPVPSMCFALDPKEQKYIVIDGLQRMSTIKEFLGKKEWLLPKLTDIDNRLSGKSVDDIKSKNPEIFRRIENVSLPVTILRYDPSRQDNMDYIFTIFQRINTFGERLNNQEIRNAIYQGPFSSFLKTCAKNTAWADLSKNNKRSKVSRMLAEEKALRFFAFYENSEKYTGKFNKFLNDYMGKKRYETNNTHIENVFNDIIKVIENVGIKTFNQSNAFIDSVLFGMAKNISFINSLEKKQILNLLSELKNNKKFSITELSEGTMKKNKVKERFDISKKIFSRKSRV